MFTSTATCKGRGREAAEAFIKSQAREGWTCLPDRHDDGGFTGGNMDRPALKRLLADIEVGKVDVLPSVFCSVTVKARHPQIAAVLRQVWCGKPWATIP